MRNMEDLLWLKSMKPHLTNYEFSQKLRNIWICGEYQSCAGVKYATLIKWFRESDKTALMTNDELDVYDNLPKVVTAYRGSSFLRLESGLSWSLSRKVGEFFYNRNVLINKNKTPSALFQAQIPREYIYAYFNDRNEEEIIVNAPMVWKSHEKAKNGFEGREVRILKKNPND